MGLKLKHGPREQRIQGDKAASDSTGSTMPIGVYPSPEQLSGGQPREAPKDLWTKIKDDPVTPLGAIITASIIFAATASVWKGTRERTQRLMKMRVAAQGIQLISEKNTRNAIIQTKFSYCIYKDR